MQGGPPAGGAGAAAAVVGVPPGPGGVIAPMPVPGAAGGYAFQRGFAQAYAIGGELGKGTYGRVLECTLTAAGLAMRGGRPLPPLAVKVLKITTSTQLTQLERECGVWSGLAHNGIVRFVNAYLEEDGDGGMTAYIVMEKPLLARPAAIGAPVPGTSSTL